MGRLQVIAIMAFNREISGRDKHLRGIVLLIHNERIFRTQCSNKEPRIRNPRMSLDSTQGTPHKES